jgi:hypothetical protein
MAHDPRMWRHWRTALLMAALWLVACQLLWFRVPHATQVRADQDRGFRGAFRLEEYAGGQARWLSPRSEVLLPWLNRTQGILSLTLTHALVERIPAQTVQVAIAERVVLTTTVTDWRPRTYRVLVQMPVVASWGVPVQVHTAASLRDDAQRALGVLFQRARLQPTVTANWTWWVPVWGLVWLCGALLWALLWLLAVPRPVVGALVVAIFTTACLAGLWAYPLEFASFLSWLLVLLACLLGWWGIGRALGWIPAHGQAIAGHHVPALAALALLGLPVFQYFITTDGITIAPQWRYPLTTVWVALALLAGAVIGALWAQRRGHAAVATWVTHWCAPAVLAVTGLWATIPRASSMFGRVSSDFNVWVIAATDWLERGSCYVVGDIAADLFGYIYKYPPTYCLVFVPLSGIHTDTLIDAYRVLDVVLIGLIGWWWVHLQPVAQRPWWWLVVAMTLNYAPLVDTLMLAQIDVVVWACIVGLYWCIRTRRDVTAGIVIALLASLKLYPVLFLGYWVGQWRWRAFWAFWVALLGINATTAVILGWREYVTFVFDVIPLIGGTTAWRDNQSMYAIVARAAGDLYQLGPFAHPWLYEATTVVAVAMGLSIALMQFRQPAPPDESPVAAVQLGGLVLWSAFAIPVAWPDYFVPVLLLWWGLFAVVRERSLAPWVVALLAISFAGIAFGNAMSFIFDLDVGVIETMLVSHKAYAGVLLYVVTMVIFWQLPRGTWHPQWRAWLVGVWRRA